MWKKIWSLRGQIGRPYDLRPTMRQLSIRYCLRRKPEIDKLMCQCICGCKRKHIFHTTRAFDGNTAIRIWYYMLEPPLGPLVWGYALFASFTQFLKMGRTIDIKTTVVAYSLITGRNLIYMSELHLLNEYLARYRHSGIFPFKGKILKAIIVKTITTTNGWRLLDNI